MLCIPLYIYIKLLLNAIIIKVIIIVNIYKQKNLVGKIHRSIKRRGYKLLIQSNYSKYLLVVIILINGEMRI